MHSKKRPFLPIFLLSILLSILLYILLAFLIQPSGVNGGILVLGYVISIQLSFLTAYLISRH